MLTAVPALAAGPVKVAVIPTQFVDEAARKQVPQLFDDYLLTAVQELGSFEVIGQEDIKTMIGFEQQKDLLACDDASCIADIGGALGVDKIVAVKIARLDDSWVTTAKLINIRETRVERPVNSIEQGDVKALLQSVPAVVAKLFGGAPPATQAAYDPGPQPEKQAAAPATAPAATQGPATQPPNKAPFDPNAGRGRRVGGTILIFGGLGLAFLGGLVATLLTESCSVRLLRLLLRVPRPLRYRLRHARPRWVHDDRQASSSKGLAPRCAAKGVARGRLGTEDAVGSPPVYWLGWLLAAVAIATPLRREDWLAWPEW